MFRGGSRMQTETKEILKKRIDIAMGKIPADLVIKNCKVVDVYTGRILEGDIAISDGLIAGIGEYNGREEVDAKKAYAAPGFIDSHIHIESAYVSPEEIGRLVIPHGTTTIVADPHEIVNVSGLTGMEYMIDASKKTALDIKYMLPSCVPATPFENAGAIVEAEDMSDMLKEDAVLGLGEFMNFPGIIEAHDPVLNKLVAAYQENKLIDGHSPGLEGNALNAYASARIHTDHECSTVEEMLDRLSRGMYVLMREGSACHDLRNLLKAVTSTNSRRCLLCSDDRQPKTIFEQGHIDGHLRICREEGIDAITAIQMASLNAAECFHLFDRGAIAPGLRADIVLLEDLEKFQVQKVWIEGELVAQEGRYLLPIEKQDISSVKGKICVKDFSKERLKLQLKSNRVHVIDILPGGVVTGKGIAQVQLDQDGNFLYNPEEDIVKIAVIERHHGTGNVAVALLRGYGIKKGAVALTVAHDSHNIIAVGVTDEDMEFAVQQLIAQNGGFIIVHEGKVLASMPMPIAGLMSDQSGEWVDEKLTQLHEIAHRELEISRDVEPMMTLCFMSLPVIPELKLTDMGLFDVNTFQFISVEADA